MSDKNEVKEIKRGEDVVDDSEELLTSLTESTYVVTKVFSWGTKKTRTLKLSRRGIENVKGGITSSIHRYDEVTALSMRDIETFVIMYANSHDYVYKSQLAMQIIQDLTSRVSLIRGLQKKRTLHATSSVDIPAKYQEKLIKEQESSPSSSSSSYSSSVSPDPKSLPRSRSDSHMRKSPTGDLEKDKRATRALKLSNLLGSTEKQRLEVSVSKLLLDTSHTEGKTISEFINNFNVLAKNDTTLCVTIRQFIDGIKEYLIENRGNELSKLTVEADQSPFDMNELSLSTIIETCLQRTVLVPINKRIMGILFAKNKESDSEYNIRARLLKNRPPSFFGVTKDFCPSNNFAPCINELNSINECIIPSDYLKVILNTARSIYTTVNLERKLRGEKSEFLSADVFVPIILYVIIQSDIENLDSLCEYVINLADQDILNGEGGYYLTVFQSALQYIKDLPRSELYAGEI